MVAPAAQGIVGANGGNGGAGGVGIVGSGLVITNQGAISGGNGGAAGTSTVAGVAGAGGVGITGSGLSIISSGTITGGSAGGGGVRANAVTFTGGTNIFELQSNTSSITGNVVAFSGADTLRLGGSGNLTFDASQIAAAGQYQNFGVFVKTGTSIWTLTGTPRQATPWAINGGTLAISLASTLNGPISFNGGTLQIDGSMALPLLLLLNAGGGPVNADGFSLGLGQTVGRPGGLTKTGAGTLTFGAPMTYSGGTTVNAGTLTLLSGSSLNAAGALTVNGGTFDLSQLDGPLTVGALSGSGGVIALGANPKPARSPPTARPTPCWPRRSPATADLSSRAAASWR